MTKNSTIYFNVFFFQFNLANYSRFWTRIISLVSELLLN